MCTYQGVPLSVRQPVINTWVETKQLLKEAISKNMGQDHEVIDDYYTTHASDPVMLCYRMILVVASVVHS